MNTKPYTRKQKLIVPDCPKCHQAHDFWLCVTLSRQRTPMLIFGGEAVPPTDWDVTLHCPNLEEDFVFAAHVTPPSSSEDILSVEALAPGEDVPPSAQPSGQDEVSEWLKAELIDRVKGSAQAAIDFSKTMITTTSGALPLYFSVLKYLGAETIGAGWARLGLVPPVLFLAAAIVFALGIRPALIELPSLEAYPALRDERLHRLDRYMIGGLALFLLGLAISALLWTILLFGDK